MAKSGKNDEALIVLNSFQFNSTFTNFPSLNYIKGNCYLNKLNYDKANEEFIQFLKIHKGTNYIKSTYYKLYLSNYLKGSNYKLASLLEKGLKIGNKEIDADKDAYQFFKDNQNPNKSLAKARLLFDGGYYDQSLALLYSSTGLTVPEKIEYNYRKARNYHGQRKLKTAIRYYKTAINLQDHN